MVALRRRRLKLRAIPCFVVACAIVLAAAAMLSTAGRSAQTPQQTSAASPGQFETLPDWSNPEFAKFVYSVVSIKPFKTDDNTGMSLGTRASPDGYTAAFPVQGLIYEAYKTEHYKIVGGTGGGVFSDLYLVQAKMDPEIMEALQKLPPEKRRIARQHMLQVLLRDYFKVVVRTEIREVPANDLVVAKKGPKLTQAAEASPATPDFKWSTEGTTQLVRAKGESVASLLAVISSDTDRPTYDKTGLTGVYDFALKFTPKRFLMDSPPTEDAASLPQQNAPPIEKALEEQLGLKLQSTTGSMEFIIIDHAERPRVN
jgi:uncharacterized protein (TIGR03435 family)